MNKIISLMVLVFIFCGVKTFSQIYVPVSPTVYGVNELRHKAFLAQHIPEKTSLLTNTNDTTAQIFMNKGDSNVWAYYKPRGFFKIGSGGGGFALDSIYVFDLIDTNMTLHPGHVSIFVSHLILDSLKHKYIDTGARMRDGYVLSFDSTNKKWVMVPNAGGGGGGGSPAGSTQEIQFNTSGSFDADNNFKWDKDSSIFKLGNTSSWSQGVTIRGQYNNTDGSPTGIDIISSDAISGSVAQGGYINIHGSKGDGTSAGGAASVIGGDGGDGGGAGGQAYVSGGNGGAIGNGGSVNIYGGGHTDIAYHDGDIILSTGNNISIGTGNTLQIGINNAYFLPVVAGTTGQIIVATDNFGSTSWITPSGSGVHTIYNSDDTITSTRVVELNGNDLNFENASSELRLNINTGDGAVYMFTPLGKELAISDDTGGFIASLEGGNNIVLNSSGLSISASTNSFIGSTWDWNDGGSNHYLNVSSSGVNINNSFTLPLSDGSSNQFMKTNGSGIVSWSNIDTTNISNFSTKVRSLFSTSSPLTYNNATGAFAITAMDATHAGYVAAGVASKKRLGGDGNWYDTTASSTGTVTSVATGLGLSGGTITTTGTLLVDTSSASILSRQRAAKTYWSLTGNTLLSRTTNYIGSSDTSQVNIDTKGVSAISIDSLQKVTISTQVIYPVGSKTIPSIAFINSTNTGFYSRGGGAIDWISGGNVIMENVGSSKFQFGVPFAWASGPPDLNAPDVGLARAAAGVLRIYDGANVTTSGKLRILVLDAGTATANTAPLKFTLASSTLTSVAEIGAFEPVSNRINYTDSTGVRYILHAGGTPTIAAGAGSGSSPTISITGIDEDGYISVTTGTLPTLSAVVATITFSSAYGATPKCVLISPANSNASLLTGVTMVFVDQAGISTTSWAITAGTSALTAATAYKFYYRIMQ